MQDTKRVLDYLYNYKCEIYGNVGQDVYDNVVDVVRELQDYYNGVVVDFNDLCTDTRVFYNDILDILNEE